MNIPRQPSLFDDASDSQAATASDSAVPTPTHAVLQVPGAAASLSKAQKEFNRLNDKLGRLRSHLAAWQAAAEALGQRRLSELVPLERKLQAAQREAVLWIDVHLQKPPAGEKLPKKSRGKLVALLRLLSRNVLEAGPDSDVEAAHDRHSAQSHVDHQRDQADMAAAVLGRAFGDEALFEGEADSVEDLLQRTAQRLQQQQDADADMEEPAAPPAGQRPSRAEKARQRDAQALQEASQSVRDVYRRLASSLHPDREPDAAARQHKTALMARANQAYAANDLLSLLAMQLELEHIDAQHLAGLPDDRLRHYNRVLKEQQQSLEAELAMLQMPVAQALEQAPGLLQWPARLLDTPFDDELHSLQQALRTITADMPLLRDARTRPQFLRGLEVEDPDDALSPLEEMLFEAALDDMAATAARPPRGGRRRR